MSSEESMDRFIRSQRLLIEARDRALGRRRDALAAASRAIAADLASMGAARVWLFGSLARGSIHGGTDLDLAVSGLKLASDQLLGVAEQHTQLPVDIVPYESASPALRRHIDEDGVLLFDRQTSEGC